MHCRVWTAGQVLTVSAAFKLVLGGEGLVQSHAGIPPWKDWTYSISLVCGCLPRYALSRFFPLTLRGVGAGSLLCWIHRWGRLLPSSLAYSAGAHGSCLFMDGCLTLCCKGTDKKEPFYASIALILFLLVTSGRPSGLSSSAEQWDLGFQKESTSK